MAPEPVQVWTSQYQRAKDATGGFTLDLSTLTTWEVMTIQNIDRAFVDWMPEAFKIFHPKFHPRLRSDFAYLLDLHERQIAVRAAWTSEALNCDHIIHLPAERIPAAVQKFLTRYSPDYVPA